MALYIDGIHHSRVPVGLREQVAITPARLSEILLTLKAYANEVVVVSTCNRLEIISETDAPEQLFEAFTDALGLAVSDWDGLIDRYADDAAVQHLMAVAAGLDSMVLGEPQILGQLKYAYAQAKEAETTGKFLSRVFQMAFKAAKTIRTETAIGTQSVSIASASVKLAKQIFSNLSQKTVMLIGTGEMVTIAAKHLHAEGVTRMIFANRTVSKAQALADMYQAQAISLAQLRERLHDVDMVISATASDVPLVGKGCVERAMKQRRHKPMVMIDLAVPRDIEPEIKQLDDVYLFDMDALREVVKVGMEKRQAAAKEAFMIIDREVASYMEWYTLQPHIANVRAYRQHHEQLRDAALSKALRNVTNGQPIEAVLTHLAHTLTNQLLHLPTMKLLSSIKEKDSA